MTSVDSNFNFLCGRPQGAGPLPPPCGRDKCMAPRLIFGMASSLFYVFAAQPRFPSSVQLLVKKELFHQSSFYLVNIVSSAQLLFQQRYLHFCGEKSGVMS